MSTIRPPFWRWLEQFPPDLIADRDNGAGRVALIADSRDDEATRRVYANAVAVLGPSWNHRFLQQRGGDALLSSPAFWESIPEEHVLVYQRDTVILRPVPDAALWWSMIGAPCGLIWTDHWAMNGGFSLRKRSAMLGVLQHVERRPCELEDVYFTRGLRERSVWLPSIQTAARFAVENPEGYIGPPVGVHGTDKRYLPDDLAERLVDEAMAGQRVMV